MRSQKVRILVETALSIALAYVLGRFAVWQMPFGGSVSLAMLPIVVLALRRGVVAGMTAGALFGVLDYTIEPFFVHWVQVFLDYPVAYALVGLAGLMRPWLSSARRGGRTALVLAAVAAGGVTGVVGRGAAHVASGVVFFAANAPEGQPVVLYSLAYNATYLLPSLVACVVAAALVVPALERAVPVEA